MEHYDYLVIGAGPAGLQMGYFLEQAGRKYVILEAQARAASFFAQQPRQRTLLTINKYNNWFDEPEFNLRYDWNSLLTHDYSLRFPGYSKELYPHADTLVKYLNDFAEKFALNIQYNTRVASITREADGERHFILTDHQGQEYRCQCLLMATGAVKPNIPEDIEGIELAEGYEVYDTNPERFTNKRVVILGNGNSAFEVANDLAIHAATIQIFTSGRLIQHAWQSHFGGDLRAINNTILDMWQLKTPHLVSGAKVTKITRQDDETLCVYYEEEVPHWSIPGTMHSVGVYDYVIRATGWRYIEPELFPPEMTPLADARSKYPVLNSMWESSVPDLFFIGAAAANNQRQSNPGFIPGFRYNIRTLFYLLEQHYHDVPLPARTFPLTTKAELETLVEAVRTRISTTSALFQMFGVLGEVLVFTPGQVKWFAELPMNYVLEQSEFIETKDLLTITLELGFDKFPKGTDALSHIHPNDPGGGGHCSAFLHPVLRHYSFGKMVNECHMHGAVFVRYDAPNEVFALEWDRLKPRNLIFNTINDIARVTAEAVLVNTFTSGEVGGFTPWPPERRRDAAEFPQCTYTHQPDYVPDPASYQ